MISIAIKEVKEKGSLNLNGYYHTIESDGLRHTRSKHFNVYKEIALKQIPLTENDFLNVPTVVSRSDNVSYGSKN